MEQIIIAKKIAKHGKQSIVVVPKLLEEMLPPGTVAKITFEILEGID